jgi:predicted DNA-binding antitoxin AbrB/MazE fold protein
MEGKPKSVLASYSNGSLHPLEPLDLPDGATVEVIIKSGKVMKRKGRGSRPDKTTGRRKPPRSTAQEELDILQEVDLPIKPLSSRPVKIEKIIYRKAAQIFTPPDEDEILIELD